MIRSKIGKKKIGLFRADSGFYDKKYLTIWRKVHNYIIAARMYAPIQHNIASRHNWLKMADGLEIAIQTTRVQIGKIQKNDNYSTVCTPGLKLQEEP
ncbi:MAG: hypothetical protein IPH98_08520 [Saprospiraceae bacterium]|nr:hypothetical protein [Candidatus Defluviibacterium haderslevense]